MNKKLAAAAMAAMMLAACSSSNSGTTAGGNTSEATVTSDDGAETTAVLTKEDGKLTGVTIDVVDAEGNSKKELGNDYNIKKASTIGKEWFEQVDFLENYILEHGVDSVKLDKDGYAESEDVKSGCTINLTDIMKAVDEANAK